MRKIKLAVIFGGMSTENAVSIVSGTSVIQNLNKEKYEIIPIYIGKDGQWYKYIKPIEEVKTLNLNDSITDIKPILNSIELLKDVEVVFPVLHGLYGEDGTIQGMLELLNKKYVGCHVLSSSLCMDKVYTKIILEKAGIEQAEYIHIKKKGNQYVYVNSKLDEQIYNKSGICKLVKETLDFPVFIKPSNSGSSVGINKAHNIKELEDAIEEAGKYDRKILIEKNIEGKEVECAVLGNENIEASKVGEILPSEEFYTFDAKYVKEESRVVIPAMINSSIAQEIREKAIKAFKAVDGSGLARIDFFVENGTNRVILNEINTLPGFTYISMYPKLWEAEGLRYTQLLDKLIELALEK